MLRKFYYFSLIQFDQIKKNNIFFFLFKLKLLFKHIFLFILIYPFLIIIRAIKPILFIRFGKIRSDVMGNFVFNPYYYLAKNENNKSLDLFYFTNLPVPNSYWGEQLKNKLWINQFFKYFEIYNSIFFSENNSHVIEMFPNKFDSKINNLFSRKKFDFDFINENNQEIKKKFFNHNFDIEKKYVCLIVRDSGYKNKFNNSKKIDWSYHDYRNSNLNTYQKSILYLISKNYNVIRMGKHVNQNLDLINTGYFDYALSEVRSDFLDIWLMYNCEFCISTSTGLDELAYLFDKPLLLVNHLPVGDYFSNPMMRVGNKILVDLYKKIRDLKSSKLLTISELNKKNLLESYKLNDYLNENTEIIDNTENEILDSVKSLLNIMEGKLEMANSELEEKFCNNIKKTLLNRYEFNSEYYKISENFLKQNSWLMK